VPRRLSRLSFTSGVARVVALPESVSFHQLCSRVVNSLSPPADLRSTCGVGNIRILSNPCASSAYARRALKCCALSVRDALPRRPRDAQRGGAPGSG